MSECIFCKIAAGDIPARKLYEDEEFLAFHDIAPAAPVHFLIIPKHHVVSLAETDAEDAPWLGRLMALVPQLAHEAGLDNGFRTIVNTGKGGGQEVFHLHVHVLGGAPLGGLVNRCS